MRDPFAEAWKCPALVSFAIEYEERYRKTFHTIVAKWTHTHTLHEEVYEYAVTWRMPRYVEKFDYTAGKSIRAYLCQCVSWYSWNYIRNYNRKKMDSLQEVEDISEGVDNIQFIGNNQVSLEDNSYSLLNEKQILLTIEAILDNRWEYFVFVRIAFQDFDFDEVASQVNKTTEEILDIYTSAVSKLQKVYG